MLKAPLPRKLIFCQYASIISSIVSSSDNNFDPKICHKCSKPPLPGNPHDPLLQPSSKGKFISQTRPYYRVFLRLFCGILSPKDSQRVFFRVLWLITNCDIGQRCHKCWRNFLQFFKQIKPKRCHKCARSSKRAYHIEHYFDFFVGF